MFHKVLIANRGEVAVRLLRASRELGLRTVTVYSEVDRTALHVRYADEAYAIGTAAASDSYLRMDRILDVARKAQVGAIHPGYGFLAENPLFAQACLDAGFIFVGPRPKTLATLGNKIAARRLIASTGIPVVAGSERLTHDGESLFEPQGEDPVATARRIGFPVLVKAAAGGGGKGMRVVRSEEELPAALLFASRAAKASFGDGTVYLERLIAGVRHIEFQILADEQGHVIHLGERECSIQRRFQKLIEESPSTALDEELRARMGQAAVDVARAAGYLGAGTVEFLLDKTNQFYFLEVNPRLQVEHAVTEMVTGVDIVKEQLRVASGRRLRYEQEDIKPHGWAMECRILAEDPDDDFMPSTGKVSRLYEPSGPGVRVDSGIYEGFEVSPFYDSLISKLATWGEARPEALLRMLRALAEYRIVGIKTTIPFFQRILSSVRFMMGNLHTGFLEEAEPPVVDNDPAAPAVAAIAAAWMFHRQAKAPLLSQGSGDGSTQSNWKRSSRWRGAP